MLAGIDPALAAEAPRERLFDVLFARLEAHAPHQAGDPQHRPRGAPRSASGAGAEPHRHDLDGLDADRGRDIRERGRGLFRAQGLALVWARVMRVWLDDDDPGLARTMAALDKRLREAERMVDPAAASGAVPAAPRGRGNSSARPSADGDIAEGHPS